MDLNDYLAENGNWIRVHFHCRDHQPGAGGVAGRGDCRGASSAARTPGSTARSWFRPMSWRSSSAWCLGWLHPGVASRIDCGGFPGVVFRGTKRRSVKEPARTWVVLDLGDRRLILA